MTTPAPPAPVRATPARRPLPPTGPRRAATPRAHTLPWVTGIASGVAVLLAGSPVSAIVLTSAWFGAALLVVAVVVATGLALHRFGPAIATFGQCAAVVLLLTVRFATDGFLLVLPGPAALREFGALISGASQQISVGIAPIAATPEILFLVTFAFGMLTVGVYLAVVGAGAPAAAGVALLALFAVPAALADQLLPWWSVVGAAAGFGLLLVLRDGARRQLGGGAAVVAGAVAVALVVGSGAGFIGTAGRFNGSGGGQTGSAGSIGLSPFTALRGQLQQSAPVELFRIRGLKEPAYMRAITLADYLPDRGWQPQQRPQPGVPLPGATGNQNPGGPLTDVQIENVAFRDYWLPLYGLPVEVAGLSAGQWAYDARSGIGYTRRVRQEGGWAEKAYLGAPTAAQLRGDNGAANPGLDYLNTTGVDQRVTDIANAAIGGATRRFDKAVALQNFFTGPGSGFAYTLQTKPGGGDDALVEFLTTGKAGYCEQYASAMAVMLRVVGVPARVAVGFTGGKVEGDYRSITTSDAHAWVEAWFPEHGWITFDPTPLNDGRAITPPYVQEAAGSAGGSTPDEDEKLPRNTQTDPGAAAEQPVPTPVDPGAAPAADQGGGVPLLPIGVIALIAIVTLVPFGVRTLERRRRLATTAAGGPAAATAAWDELLAESVDRGMPARSSDTVRATARRMVKDHHLEPPAQQALRDVVGAVESSWYGGGHPPAGSLDEPLQAVRAGIATGTALSVRQRLLPSSVTAALKRRVTGSKEEAPAESDVDR